ncbi:alkyl hydroperoxide reductase subunit F, partial [Granulicatella balaenopterae]
FAGIPLGHEFSSFVLALLQVSGRAPKIDEALIKQIKAIDKAYHFESIVSLTCHICPEVVQTLNIFAVLNPFITHTMIEGGIHQDIVKERDIMAVPTVYLNGEEFSSGKLTVEQLLEKLAGSVELDESITNQVYDSLIIGGGPAGASAAIYSARKGIKTALVCEEFGGQVMETLGIENMIGTPYTEGPKLMAQVGEHVKQYNVQQITGQRVTHINKQDLIEVTLANGTILKTKSAIISTGARWRHINVPGEKEFKNKGVAYCPHCDGPIFAGKPVAVIGGGNSGIEAAIDLAGIVSHVYVLEFLPELKADKVLQDKLYSLKNVTVITNAQTTEITGTNSVEGLSYIDRKTQAEHHLAVEGVFVLIGLMPNTEWLKDSVDLNNRGEIKIDATGQTSLA